MVPRLLALKTAADEAVRRAFDGGEAFAATAREAFEHAVNARANKPPELIAKFVDGVLRAQEGAEPRRSARWTARSGCSDIVQGKDAFEAFYKKDNSSSWWRQIRLRGRGEIHDFAFESGVRRAVHGEAGGDVQGCGFESRLDESAQRVQESSRDKNRIGNGNERRRVVRQRAHRRLAAAARCGEINLPRVLAADARDASTPRFTSASTPGVN